MLPFEPSPPGGALALWVLIASVVSAALSVAVAVVLLVRLPPDALKETLPAWPRSLPGLLLRLGRNVLGWSIILLGLLLSIPGVPGQGIVTIALGLLLVDFPGRGTLLRKVLARPPVRRKVDRLRARFGQPPFTW